MSAKTETYTIPRATTQVYFEILPGKLDVLPRVCCCDVLGTKGMCFTIILPLYPKCTHLCFWFPSTYDTCFRPLPLLRKVPQTFIRPSDLK